MGTHAQTRVCTIAGVNTLFVLVMLVGHLRYYHPAQLLGEYDGGGKMSKGLGVQAHDLGWDGGEDYKSSGVTYSHLPVVSEPSVSVDRWFPDWKQLTSAPPAYSNSVQAYSNLPVVSEPSVSVDKWFPDWEQLTSAPPAYSNSVQAYSSSVSAEMGSGGRHSGNNAGGLQSAINTGFKAAWGTLAGVVSMHGCDAACLKDMYRRAFRARQSQHAHKQQQQDSYTPAQRDKDLFGQVATEEDVTPQTFSTAYRDVSSLAVDAAPKVLGVLSTYLPQAVLAEKQLARAIAQRNYGPRGKDVSEYGDIKERASDQEHRSQFQYKLTLNDEYDARAQRPLRRFVQDEFPKEEEEHGEEGKEADMQETKGAKAGAGGEEAGKKKKSVEEEGYEQDPNEWHVVVDDKTHQPVEEAPVLKCGEGDKKEEDTWGKLDRMDDCNFGRKEPLPEDKEREEPEMVEDTSVPDDDDHDDGDTQQYYNRMWYLDREKSGHPASARLIRNHMRGVTRLVDKWKPLLVGAGGGSGEPSSFDDPYYFCYDQYQEDPEFSQCLRDMVEHSKTFSVRKWARPAIASPGDGDAPIRPGFPELRKEWEDELKDDPTDESSKPPPSLEPYGGSDWFEEYF